MFLPSFSIVAAALRMPSLLKSSVAHRYGRGSGIRLPRKTQVFLVHSLMFPSVLWLVGGVFINGKEKLCLLKYSLPVLRLRGVPTVN